MRDGTSETFAGRLARLIDVPTRRLERKEFEKL
jgi:hypothetical protein